MISAPAGATCQLSHFSRKPHRRRGGAIGRGNSFGAIRLSQGQHGRTGSAETRTQGTGVSRGSGHDFEVGEQPSPVRLVQPIMHAGGDEAGVAGVKTENEPARGCNVEGGVGVGNHGRERSSRGTGEAGYLGNKNNRAEIEAAVSEELNWICHLRYRQDSAAVQCRSHVVAVALHLPCEGKEIGDGKRGPEEMIGGDKSSDEGRGRRPESARYGNVRAHQQRKSW
jgi:hypothetical protein